MTLIDPAARTIGPFSVGPLAFGCWRFVNLPTAEATALIEAALGAGMNLIDTADVYGLDWGGDHFGQAEELLGDVLTASPGLRDQMVLATKGGIMPPVPYDSSPVYLRQAVEASLRRLNTDVIDLYQIHRPDLYTHPGALAEALDELIDSGTVRSVGVSNYTPAQTEALRTHLAAPLVTTQPQFSAVHLGPLWDGTFDGAMAHGIVPLVWSPLAGGRLATGDGLRPELVATLDRLAAREGVDRATMALAFVLAHPARPVAIVGSQRAGRLTSATSALGVALDRNDCYDIIEASQGEPLP